MTLDIYRKMGNRPQKMYQIIGNCYIGEELANLQDYKPDTHLPNGDIMERNTL